MRIFELSRPENRVKADEFLRDNGWRRLNKGAFGAVYKKIGFDYVLKVFSATDKAYLDYLSLIRKHQDNPHFPKIYGKLIKVTDMYYAVRMEELKPSVNRYLEQQIDEYFSFLFYKTEIEEYSETEYKPEILVYMEEKQPVLKQACDLIQEDLVDGKKYQTDLKSNNFMQRENTIIITDPIKFFCDIPQEKLPYLPPEGGHKLDDQQ